MGTTRREAFAALAAMLSGSALVSGPQSAGPTSAKPPLKPAATATPRKLATVMDFEALAKQHAP